MIMRVIILWELLYLNLALKKYFEPLKIEGNIDCETCNKPAIGKLIRYIYKFSNNLFITFNDFKSLITQKDEIKINLN